MHLRTSAELTAVSDPVWPHLAAMMRNSDGIRVLDIDRAAGETCIARLQVTARSTLGALALNTGGLVTDHGWFRLLGGGSDGLPDLATANNLDPSRSSEPPSHLLVGFDVLGGQFAIDGGGLGVAPGHVCYFGPDTLAWTGLGVGHSNFVVSAIDGTLGEMFTDLRWDGWEQEVAGLRADQGLALYPPPFTAEGRDLSTVSRAPVPMAELLSLYPDAARQLGDLPPGSGFVARIV